MLFRSIVSVPASTRYRSIGAPGAFSATGPDTRPRDLNAGRVAPVGAAPSEDSVSRAPAADTVTDSTGIGATLRAPDADAACAVVQTLWSGERTDLQACPAVVQITAATPARLQAAADAIRTREAPFASADYLSASRDIKASAEGGASYNSDEVWMFVSQAVSAWSARSPA